MYRLNSTVEQMVRNLDLSVSLLEEMMLVAETTGTKLGTVGQDVAIQLL